MSQAKLQKDKLYIGNIDYSVSLEELVDFIKSKCDCEIRDTKLLEGKGKAFITFASDDEALKVKEAINEQKLKERVLKVDVAKHRQQSGPSRNDSNRNSHYKKRRPQRRSD